jgi:hypothetical protein
VSDKIKGLIKVTIVVIVGLITTISGAATAAGEQSLLVQSDLVVRGIITDISAEMGKREEWHPGGLRPEWPYPVTVLKLESVEVLKGFWTENEIVVASGGGWPDDYPPSPHRAYVMNQSYNYAIGDEVVLSLWYAPTVRGGAYIVLTDDGRFIQKGSEWENQGPERQMWTIAQIREMTNRGNPQMLLQESALVVKGIVGEISAGDAHLSLVSISVQQVWKGNVGADQIEFRIVCGELSTDPWTLPSMSTGEVWIVSLNKDERGYCALGGRNGMFKVEDGDVLFAGKIKSPFTERSLRDLAVREEQDDH